MLPFIRKLQIVTKRAGAFLVRHWRGLVVIGSIGLLGVWCGIFLLQALYTSLFFNGFGLDGAFQLFNPLHRMAQGEVLGRDVQFFHGVGVPLLHFPLFWALGGDLFASEMVRWLLSPALFLLSTGLIFWIITKKWWATLLSTFVVTSLSFSWIAGMIYPENSLLGFRSVGVVFVLAGLLARDKLKSLRVWRFSAYQLLLPFALACAWLCGTEQGLGALAAFVIVEFFANIKRPWLEQLKNLGVLVGMFIAWLLLLLTLITVGHPFDPLYYSFAQVGVDQFWYFGTSPNDFLHWERIFTTQLNHPFMIQIYVLTALVVTLLIAYRKKAWLQSRLPALWFATIAGAITGIVASTGYWATQVFIPHARLLLLVIFIVSILWLMQAIKSGQVKRDRLQWGIGAVFVVLIGWSVMFTQNTSINLVGSTPMKETLKKTYQYFVTRTDTETVDIGWRGSMNRFVPIINADNAVDVIESGADGYKHGVNLAENKILVANDKFAPLLTKGQIVYLPVSGRHRIASAVPDGKFIAVTLEAGSPIANDDGYPSKMTISERLDKDPTHLWSTYAALTEAEMKYFAPNHGYDYIIHALGKDRDQYFADFEAAKPEFVITTLPAYSVHVEWLEQRAWPIYARLLENYTFVAITGSQLLWQKNDGQEWKPLDYTTGSKELKMEWADVPEQKNIERIVLPENNTDKPQIIIVTVEYRVDGWVSKVPMLQRLPRYVLLTRNTESITDFALPPSDTTRTFPVVLQPNQKDGYLWLRAFSLIGGAELHITKATYQQPDISAENYQGFLGNFEGPVIP